MGKHRHEPVRRIDPIVAASRAHVRVARENRAVQHQHVLAEHEHAAVHRRRIRDPACAGAFAAHRISEIDGGVHFHLHFIVLVRRLPRRGRRVRRMRRDRARGDGRLGVDRRYASTLSVATLDVRRFFSFIGTSFIPHFGQFPG